jgi:succinate-acetate transporter protein
VLEIAATFQPQVFDVTGTTGYILGRSTYPCLPETRNNYMTEPAAIRYREETANPAPLGLFGFGMTTVLLNLHNAGLFKMNAMILAMGLCYGGVAQIIAGIMEFKKSNTFGMTAFVSYGFFWLSLVAIILLPRIDVNLAPDNSAMGAYLAMWGLFTLALFIGTFRLSVALQVVFGTLVILFFMLAYVHLAKAGETFEHITGYEGMFCGLSAIYTGAGLLLNEVYGKNVLPLGPVAIAHVKAS